MIKFYTNKKKIEQKGFIPTITEAIKNNMIYLGGRYFVDAQLCYPATCVHITPDRRYIFSLDNILFKTNTYENALSLLSEMSKDGKNPITSMTLFSSLENIDFFFLPNVYQIFKMPEKEDYRFSWYKKQPISIIKSLHYYNDIVPCYWYLEEEDKENEKNHYGVSREGILIHLDRLSKRISIGVPIFFSVGGFNYD